MARRYQCRASLKLIELSATTMLNPGAAKWEPEG